MEVGAVQITASWLLHLAALQYPFFSSDFQCFCFFVPSVSQNPAFYQLPRDLSDEQLKMRLRSICLSSIKALADFGMLTTDADGFQLRPEGKQLLTLHIATSKFMCKHCTRGAPLCCGLHEEISGFKS